MLALLNNLFGYNSFQVIALKTLFKSGFLCLLIESIAEGSFFILIHNISLRD